MRPTIFIAGPLGGAGRCEAQYQWMRVDNVMVVAERVYHMGGVPFVPHLFWYWATFHRPRLGREDWILMDDHYLMGCHALVRVDGHSPGADREKDMMLELKRPVFYASSQTDWVPHGLEAWIAKFRTKTARNLTRT